MTYLVAIYFAAKNKENMMKQKKIKNKKKNSNNIL